MIKLLEENKIPQFNDFIKNYINGINIYTRLCAYGLSSPFQTFWYCENEKEITLALNKSDNVLTLCGEISDTDEFLSFIPFSGADTIIADYATIKKFNFDNCTTAVTMKFTGKPENTKCTPLSGENIKNIFDVIYENSDCSFGDWYTDISHKIRHNLIRGFSYTLNDKYISSALTSGETPDKAIISSVAVLQNYRHKGIGEKTVKSLINSLSADNKEIYLFTDNPITVKWYNSMGFSEIGKNITVKL